MEMTTDELGLCMVEVFDQIVGADPKAHRGRAVDAAAYKVAKLVEVTPIEAVRAYRMFRPLPAHRKPLDPRSMLSWQNGKAPEANAVEGASVPCALA